MSEYQYIEFRAVDRPLTDKELAFAEKQSSGAEISRSCFSNEYHYGSFRALYLLWICMAGDENFGGAIGSPTPA